LSAELVLDLNAVILAVTEDEPRILTVRRAEGDALPSGPLDPDRDRTLELALRGWVLDQAGFELGYAEQLYTFANRYRDPREREGGPRLVSVAYLALVRETALAGFSSASWAGIYELLPWEDWRGGRPRVIDEAIAPALESWIAGIDERAGRRARRERADIAFGLRGAQWNGERVLDRFELLYEVGLVEESGREAKRGSRAAAKRRERAFLGRAFALDHRRILASALGRLRGKLRYRPVVFELMPPTFTLLQLQRVVEALAGLRLHKQNFRRVLEKGGLVEGTGTMLAHTGGRPAELFRFRRDVLRERPAPGVGLPRGERPS
jgi:hypothetical protein